MYNHSTGGNFVASSYPFRKFNSSHWFSSYHPLLFPFKALEGVKVEPPFTTQTPTQPRATRGGVSSYHLQRWKSYDWSTLMKIKTITTTLVSSFTFSVESSDGDREQVVGLDQQNKPPQMH
mgnify:CR=1 FL=1